MGFKLIALDIDGTLVDDHKKIMPETKALLKKLRQQGIYIVLCTGRPLIGVANYLADLALTSNDDYVITYNGAKAQNVGTKEDVVTNLLTQKQYLRLLKWTQQVQVKSQIVTPSSHVYTTQADISPYTVLDAFYTKMPLHYRTMEDLTFPTAAKFMLVDEPAVLDQAVAKLDPALQQEFYTVRSEDWFFEFMHPHAHKGQAVLDLAMHLGISPDEIIAFGDQNNDLTMLEMVGLGVAMGNANPNLKKVANQVTLDNNHEGIAVCLRKIFA